MDSLTEARLEKEGGETIEARIEGMRRYLHGRARKFVQDPDEAQDLVQDTLYRMLRSRTHFKAETSLENWASMILQNRYIELYRARKRRQAESLDSLLEDRPWFEIADPAPSLESEYLAEMDWEQASGYLEGVPKTYQEVARRHYLHGQKLEQIAEEMGLQMGTVKTRLWRARLHMRARLAAFERRAERELAAF